MSSVGRAFARLEARGLAVRVEGGGAITLTSAGLAAGWRLRGESSESQPIPFAVDFAYRSRLRAETGAVDGPGDDE